MHIPFNPIATIESAILAAATSAGLDISAFDPMVKPADPRFGDYQANGILPYAKKNKTNPRELAQKVLTELGAGKELDPKWYKIDIAGPGFINFTLSQDFLLEWLKAFSTEEVLASGAKSKFEGQNIIIDFSAPNTAKEMHVGHIRSTVIGDAISRLYLFSGAKVIRDNHIGDWGTQFGMLIWGIKKDNFDLDSADPSTAIKSLEEIYKKANAAYKQDDTTAENIRSELVKLQTGDKENLEIWNKITDISWKAFQSIYNRLDIRFDEVLGESFYRDKVDSVYSELQELGIAEESEGALVVFHKDHKRFSKQPFIVRKKDGASNYATTDLATVLYRSKTYDPDKVIYVVDSRQSDHFEQLFLTSKVWFEKSKREVPDLRHVSFGTVLGENGKPIKTKEGGSIKLKELLSEAVERSTAIVREKNPTLSDKEVSSIAEAVGIGAIKYTDLSQNRTSDYVFSWDRMLSFEGNTAPYLLYAVARIHSIFNKEEIKQEDFDFEPSTFEEDEEVTLARKLLGFSSALDLTLSDLRPHALCTYIFELAGAFSSFYNANRVIVDNPGVRSRRLLLCQRTLLIMETGLKLLGLKTLKRM